MEVRTSLIPGASTGTRAMVLLPASLSLALALLNMPSSTSYADSIQVWKQKIFSQVTRQVDGKTDVKGKTMPLKTLSQKIHLIFSLRNGSLKSFLKWDTKCI